MSATPKRLLFDPLRVAACDGKEAFASPALAARVLKRRFTRGRHGNVYRCQHCGQWHIGSRDWMPPKKRPAPETQERP